ncbi:hypothetical protein BGX28_001718 [Mortierella sp. GBA30]|nr:hypothetical protein BGX28_001718 [Mortierella sp. GBA30]
MAAPNTIELILPNYGTLLGEVDQERQVAIFRNVPYATVPERWRAAVKATPWTGVRDATKQGPICPQPPAVYTLFTFAPENVPQAPEPDQDELHGLNLNIVVPLKTLKTDASRIKPIPVMTWIHGGAFREGSNAVPLYNATNLVHRSVQLDRPVIVIGVNYRLNVFGFLASKELQQELEESTDYASLTAYDRSVGNWGLMDQKLAFEWVRENISVFGGDAGNVTAFGESAGSCSLHYHMILPSHHGLFDHAILQSGTVDLSPAGHVHLDGQASFDDLLQKVNIPMDLDAREKMRRLRALSQEDLTFAAAKLSPVGFHPYYDSGGVFPSLPINGSNSNSKSTNVIQAQALHLDSYDPNLKSIMIGTTKDEGTATAHAFFGDLTVQTWPRLFSMLAPIPTLAALFETIYGVPKRDEDVARITSEICGNKVFQFPAQRMSDMFLRLQETRGADRFSFLRYHFDAEIKMINEVMPGMGALHGGEIPFVFGPPSFETIFTEDEMYLSREMQSLWILFANQQNYLTKKTAFGQGRAPAPENGEAWVMTKEHKVEIGKGNRLTDDAMALWGKVAQVTVENAEVGFLETKL